MTVCPLIGSSPPRFNLNDIPEIAMDALIMATEHTAAPLAGDAALLVDIDLAILGAVPARFAEYERQIRQEYAWVPQALFVDKRRTVLQGFAGRTQLYTTAYFQGRLEATARHNLQRALQSSYGPP